MIKTRYTRLSSEGEDQHALWLAFRNFIEDFTTFDEKELPELALWERYLPYASALGVADKLITQLKIRYPENTNVGAVGIIPVHSTWQTINSLDHLNSSLGDFASSLSVNSVSSSSSGGGGGFSGGGGGGGGGSSGAD